MTPLNGPDYKRFLGEDVVPEEELSTCIESRRGVASFLLAVSLWLFAGHANAQLPDLAEVSGQYVPPAELVSRPPAKVGMTAFNASANLPIPLSNRTFLIPGLAYHFDSLSYSDTPPNFTELRAFHSVEAPLLAVQLLPNDWALSVRLAPGLAGDFLGFDIGLLHLSALVLGTHSFSSHFSLGGGAIVTYAFGSLLLLPAVSIDWKPLDGVQVLAFVPVLFSAKYTIGGRLEIGVRADIGGNSYSIRDSRVTDVWPCVANASDNPATPANEAAANPAECIDHVAYSVGVAGAQVGVRLFDSIWWTAFAGATIYRRLDQQNINNDPISGGELTIPNEFVVRSSLAWRIPIDSRGTDKGSSVQ